LASPKQIKHLKKAWAAKARRVASMSLDERRALTAAATDKMRRAMELLKEVEKKRAG
jgi:hypothetical protein